MSKTKDPNRATSPISQTNNQSVGASKSPTSVFVGMALDMTWRLAIVVLLPIIAGFKLDEKLHMSPLLTITGFLLAMSGTAIVMWQTYTEANAAEVPKPTKEKK